MARARTLKPEFFDDEALARVSHTARLTFAGLWTLADRRGRLEDRALRIRARLFPYEPEIDLEPVLDELAARQLIVRYAAEVQVNGHGLVVVPLIQVRSFEKHQHVHPRESDSPWPAPADARSGPPPTAIGPHLADDHQGSAGERHGEPGKGTASREKPGPAGKSRDEPGKAGTSRAGSSGSSGSSDLPYPSSLRSEGGDAREPPPTGPPGSHGQHAYCGTQLHVPRFLHEDFTATLGQAAERYDLEAWYAQLDHELVEAGHPPLLPDRDRWLKDRFAGIVGDTFRGLRRAGGRR